MTPPRFIASRQTMLVIAAFLTALWGPSAFAGKATVTESVQTFRTYPFSDPDPVARMGNIYPFFRFQGYSMVPVDHAWKIITLENAFIRVLVAPEIGGKILGAVEKSTGKEFIYYNRVMKFREIAMRGPWTSGGIEFNFGDIGHTPTTATPVDYTTRTNPDGSVSCIVGALDLPSRTEWRVEIRLPADKALFETRAFWYNPTPLSTTLYHWTNAGVGVDSSLQVVYPGTAYIGHAGELSEWPVNRAGRDLSWYRNNAFGSYKSYHVLGAYTDYFGARWDGFGVIHWSPYTDKPGKKLWIWGLSREGEIWRDLLADTLKNTQYIELQSGLHFNQAMMQSSKTPFKHMEFLPQSSHRFSESWFPFVGLGGVTRATPGGVLHVQARSGRISFAFCPTGSSQEEITVRVNGKIVYTRRADLAPLLTIRDSVEIAEHAPAFEITIGGIVQYSSSEDSLRSLQRPLAGSGAFDWNSAYGLSVNAREHVRQRDPNEALVLYRAALAKDPTFLPALAGAAELLYGKMEYDSALVCAREGLSIDAYDPGANYLYGLIQRRLHRPYDAKDGFGLAARSLQYRPAAYVQLAEMSFLEGQWSDAAEYAHRALDADAYSISALQLLAVIARCRHDIRGATAIQSQLLELDPLNHFARCEAYLAEPSTHTRSVFVGMIRTELTHEPYLEIAAGYMRLGLTHDALATLSLAPRHPMVELWLSYVFAQLGQEAESSAHLRNLIAADPTLVFPHRGEERDILRWCMTKLPHWKIRYYLALVSWNLGRREDARAQFDACGNTPDFAPFYLTRAGFAADSTDHARADCQRALAIGPDEWRTYTALAGLLNETGDYQEALRVCRSATERFPHSYVLSFLLARTLLFSGRYTEARAILDTLAILPFEGARYGHDTYRQACLLTGVVQFQRGERAAALGSIDLARLWPERLGAGKPYDVDVRIEDFVQAMILDSTGRSAEASRRLSSVIAYSSSHPSAAGAQSLVSALALRVSGKPAEARAFLEERLRRDPADEISRWSMAVYLSQRDRVKEIESRLRTTLLNRTTGDQEFVLVADIARMMDWAASPAHDGIR